MLRSISRLGRMSLVVIVAALGACADSESPTGIEYPMPIPPTPPRDTPFALDGGYANIAPIRTVTEDVASVRTPYAGTAKPVDEHP